MITGDVAELHVFEGDPLKFKLGNRKVPRTAPLLNKDRERRGICL